MLRRDWRDVKDLKIVLIGTDPEIFMERSGKVINIIPYMRKQLIGIVIFQYMQV